MYSGSRPFQKMGPTDSKLRFMNKAVCASGIYPESNCSLLSTVNTLGSCVHVTNAMYAYCIYAYVLCMYAYVCMYAYFISFDILGFNETIPDAHLYTTDIQDLAVSHTWVHTENTEIHGSLKCNFL